MFVNEIFYGLQGEGQSMGFPSIFIRLCGCNLKCEGFGCEIENPKTGEIIKGCDSIPAVSSVFKDEWFKYECFDDLVADIISEMPKDLAYNEERTDIIFTGGEPLIQHKNEILIDTVKYFVSRGHKVWFETNGTIDIDFNKFPIYKQISFSISTKMKTSGEPIGNRWKPEVVDSYLMNTKDSYFKFVMSKDLLQDNAKEIEEFLTMIPTYGTVYCMPQGETQEELIYNAKSVYEFALKNGFRYSDRIHIRIHNDKRGV